MPQGALQRLMLGATFSLIVRCSHQRATVLGLSIEAEMFAILRRFADCWRASSCLQWLSCNLGIVRQRL